MPTTTLVIDGDRDRFSLALSGGTLTVGDDPAHPGGVARGLRVIRIRCEVEVEGDGADTAQLPREIGRSRLSLSAPLPAATKPPSSVTGMPHRLLVIDGADHGHSFKLPAKGSIIVGRAGAGTDIGLGDLHVARHHCQLDIDADGITVTHVAGAHGTLIDGRKVEKPEPLRPGSILRVGNSHLRLEAGVFPDDPAPALKPATTTKPLAVPTKPADPMAALQDHVMGHFRLGPIVGRGFTGAVFRATDEKTHQTCAVKVFAAEFPVCMDELGRFSKAMKDGAHAKHPNLTNPLGAGKTGHHCWIAREFVEGESAADVIQRIADGEKPNWSRAAWAAVHLARVLDDLHRHHLIHGNITPRNVLLRKSDHLAKLTDLQVGKALEGSKLAAAVQERKRQAELPYLAPEQAEPGAFVDDLADLYAVGAVAYALATGRPPVAGRTPEEVLAAVRAGRVTKPSAVNRKIPAAFEAILMKMLAHDQADRFSSPAAVLEDLEPLAQFPEAGR